MTSIRIKRRGEHPHDVDILIDGKRLEGATSYVIAHEAGSPPAVTISLRADDGVIVEEIDGITLTMNDRPVRPDRPGAPDVPVLAEGRRAMTIVDRIADDSVLGGVDVEALAHQYMSLTAKERLHVLLDCEQIASTPTLAEYSDNVIMATLDRDVITKAIATGTVSLLSRCVKERLSRRRECGHEWLGECTAEYGGRHVCALPKAMFEHKHICRCRLLVSGCGFPWQTSVRCMVSEGGGHVCTRHTSTYGEHVCECGHSFDVPASRRSRDFTGA